MKIDRTFDAVTLPPSFDLKKYDASARFNIGDWYTNLACRGIQRSMLDLNAAGINDGFYDDELKRVPVSLFENPIFPFNVMDASGYVKNFSKSQIKDRSAFEALTEEWNLEIYGESDGRAKTYTDALSIVKKDMSGPSKLDENFLKALDTLAVPAWKVVNELGLDLQGEVTVNVDLYASEEKLINDFRTWLRSTRTELGIPDLKSRFDDADFKKWHQYRILPYLDIALWAKIKGYNLTNQTIGIALFPDEYNVALAERIRKVVAPMAQAAVSIPFLEALGSQAYSELGQE